MLSHLSERHNNEMKNLGSASACEIISNYESDIDGCVIESGFGTEIPLMRILDLEPDDVEYDPKYGFENLRTNRSVLEMLLRNSAASVK